jgi:hypothetical protein
MRQSLFPQSICLRHSKQYICGQCAHGQRIRQLHPQPNAQLRPGPDQGEGMRYSGSMVLVLLISLQVNSVAVRSFGVRVYVDAWQAC